MAIENIRVGPYIPSHAERTAQDILQSRSYPEQRALIVNQVSWLQAQSPLRQIATAALKERLGVLHTPADGRILFRDTVKTFQEFAEWKQLQEKLGLTDEDCATAFGLFVPHLGTLMRARFMRSGSQDVPQHVVIFAKKYNIDDFDEEVFVPLQTNGFSMKNMYSVGDDKMNAVFVRSLPVLTDDAQRNPVGYI